jgi:endonuclease/exonuclease/phosphatase family metal-dependent hydrolase
MTQSSRGLEQASPTRLETRPVTGQVRVASWNLLRRVGAGVEDVAALVRSYRPDLLLLQEATGEITNLPDLVGGHFFHEPMQKRIYGLAVWSPHALARPRTVRLPVSALPGGVPPRIAQIIHFAGINFANVHLSHGQFLNRWQLLHITRGLKEPAAIIGDFNAVGPTRLPGFRDIGPREATHYPSNIVPLRLDRCLGRGLRCNAAEVLERGPSDHHPIILELAIDAAASGRRVAGGRR